MSLPVNRFRWPNSDEHCTILGCTGSGKTTLASHILSRAPFDRMPFIAVDMKGDDLLASIPRLKEIDLGEPIPTEPYLYVVRPLPSDQEGVEDWLRRVWEKGNVGLYIDEAYLMPDKKWLRNILAQGRSLRIPVIAGSQRPVDVPRSIFSESSHIAVFRLNDRRDKKTVSEFTPPTMLDQRLPDYHSYWFNVKDQRNDDAEPWFVLAPAPKPAVIIDRINDRLKPVVHVT